MLGLFEISAVDGRSALHLQSRSEHAVVEHAAQVVDVWRPDGRGRGVVGALHSKE